METDAKFSLLNKVLLVTLPVLAVLGTLFPLFIGMPNLSLLGIYLAVPMFLSSIIYIKYKQNILSYINTKESLFSIFISSYFLLFSISVTILYLYDIRPYIYYFIIVMMSTLLASEILLFQVSEKKVNIILFQIMILVLDLLWGVTLKYDYFLQRTDPLFHIYLIQNLANNFHITDIFGIYKPFPLWHILCASLYAVLGIPYNDINKLMFFTNGLIYSFIIPITYLIVNRISNDKKISLLSSLFLAISPDSLIYGMASIPRSVVTFLELILILLLFDSKNKIKKSLSLFIVICIIIYHTVSMPFLIIIFIGICLLQKLFINQTRSPFIRKQYIILVIIITFFYWIYYGHILFEALIQNIVIAPPSGILTKSVIYTPFAELFNYLQYSLLALFVIVGFFEGMGSKKISELGKMFCIIGLFGTAVAFPGPILLINKLSGNFNIMRFGEYLFFFISVCAAVGLLNMYLKARKNKKIYVLILFTLFAFLTISNDFVASDNPLVKRPFFTYYLTDEEITAFNQIIPISTDYVMSDYVTTYYINNSQYNNKSHILEVDAKNMKFLRNSSKDIILVRDKELVKRPLRFYTSKTGIFISNVNLDDLDYYYNDLVLWNDLEKYNKIYDSKDIKGYY